MSKNIPDKLFFERVPDGMMIPKYPDIGVDIFNPKLVQLRDNDIEYHRAPEWVSVEERLPEVMNGSANPCLVLAKRYPEQTMLFYGIGYFWESGWEVEGTYARHVEYWMPLPPSPSDGV